MGVATQVWGRRPGQDESVLFARERKQAKGSICRGKTHWETDPPNSLEKSWLFTNACCANKSLMDKCKDNCAPS